jgi:hypothetical protein
VKQGADEGRHRGEEWPGLIHPDVRPVKSWLELLQQADTSSDKSASAIGLRMLPAKRGAEKRAA